MDRFSLLLLEPGEIYFEDFAVRLYTNPDQHTSIFEETASTNGTGTSKRRSSSELTACNSNPFVNGWLKLCSKSIVFVPQEDLRKPLIKIPLADCKEIKEWIPKSFQSQLVKEQELLSVSCTTHVEMMERNVVAPFKFVRAKQGSAVFVFALRFCRVDDHLASMCQLQRASTLTPVDQNAMIATIVYSRQNRIPFDSCSLESLQETILYKTVGNKITPLVVNPGRIVLTNVILYFQPYNNAEPNPVIKIPLASIKRIFQRRYLLRPLGLEIDYENTRGRRDHIYLTFEKPEERQKLYHKLIQQDELLRGLEDVTEDNMTLRWQNGVISNFEYLLYLNSAADRSFNDLTQYPVFPWVIADYTSEELDLSQASTFRDLSKPMGALDADRLVALRERTQDMPEPRFLYGSHYSTPGFILYFLVRSCPECMLCLQNGRFDHPDRMFNSVPQTWINVTTHHSDFKELIPEFYMPENNGDFLQNLHSIDFGVRHCGREVGDVELPPWAKGSHAAFIEKLREALESDYVSRNLHKWIDLIFGYKQRGKEAEKADNLFYHLCYEGSVDLDTIQSPEDRYALEVQIGEFGQVPKQLFTSPHPQKASTPVEPFDSLPPLVDGSGDVANGGVQDLPDASLSVGGSVESGGAVTHAGAREAFPGANKEAVVKYWKNIKLIRRVCDYLVHKEAVSSVSISVDNLWVFSTSHDSILKMYSLDEMSVLRSITVENMVLSCCFPLPNNKTVLLGSRDNNMCSYSIEYSRISDYLTLHRDAVSCMDWENGILATGSWDSTVKLWQCSEANGYKIRLGVDEKAELEHSSQVTCLHLCTQHSQLVTGTRDGKVVLWCLDTSHVIQELPAHRRQVQAVRFSPDGIRVVSCGSDFFMKLIDLKTGSILFSKDLGEELTCLAWDGRTAIVGGGSGNLSLWDLIQGTPIFKIPAHKGPVTALWVSNDGDYIASGGDDRRVIVWTTKKS